MKVERRLKEDRKGGNKERQTDRWRENTDARVEEVGEGRGWVLKCDTGQVRLSAGQQDHQKAITHHHRANYSTLATTDI